MDDPTTAKESEFKIDVAEINALLQARGTGKVGAILVRNGVPTKNGGKSLYMLRGLAARGLVVERPAEDEHNKTIVYFDLASRADLKFLDGAACEAIIQLANANAKTSALNLETLEAIKEAETKVREVGVLLAEFEASMRKIRGAVADAETVCLEMAAEAGPDAAAWLKMAEASRILGAEIDRMMT